MALGRKGRLCPLFNRNTSADKGVGGLVPIDFGAAIQSDVDFSVSFPWPVDIIGIQSIETSALTGNSVITLDVGGSNVTTTHTITATAAGTRLRTAIDPDGSGNDEIKDVAANTAIVIECDGTASGGEAIVILEWRHAREI